MSEIMRYKVLLPRQSDQMDVFSFTASAGDIQRFARIDRIGRDQNGRLTGFQRPKIANHIREIRSYLESPDAILPNPIVVAFTDGVDLQVYKDGTGLLEVDVSQGPKGWIVDGQQRFMALSEIPDKSFEVFVSGFICRSEEELHRQFILINNTRPLPKSLIYELLPSIKELPDRMGYRSIAASLVELLNYREESSLKGQIHQHTNPYGVLSDTAFQKVIMNSLSDGTLRVYYQNEDFAEKSFGLLSNFFQAVQRVFKEEWDGHKPQTSRLVHGAGIVSMGYVMETARALTGSSVSQDFEPTLACLKGRTAWSSGVWDFGDGDFRKWNSVQNVPGDIRKLSEYLVRELKRNYRENTLV